MHGRVWSSQQAGSIRPLFFVVACTPSQDLTLRTRCPRKTRAYAFANDGTNGAGLERSGQHSSAHQITSRYHAPPIQLGAGPKFARGRNPSGTDCFC